MADGQQQDQQQGPEYTKGTPEYTARMVKFAETGIDPALPADKHVEAEKTAQRPEWLPEKFWDVKTGQANYEALAKSYAHLEKGRGQPQPDQQPDQQPNAGAAQAATEQAGLDWDKLSAKIGAGEQLGLEEYAAFAKAGIPKAVVDNYIEGLSIIADARVERSAAYVAQQTGNPDGAAHLESMLTWAKALPQTQQDYINSMLAGEDTWKEGLNALGIAFERAHPMGAEGNPLNGEAGGSAGAFETQLEMVRAINDPRYKESPSYRQLVQQRIALSKF